MESIKSKIRNITAPYNVEGIHYATGRHISVEIINGEIARINETHGLKSDYSGTIIAPGLIDNQINGYSNVNFSGEELTAEKVIAATRAIWCGGVTSFMPTLITNSHLQLLKNLRTLDEACRADIMTEDSIPGFHLEGPYLSPEEGFRGCHPVQYMRKPDWREFTEYQKAAGGRIIQVTIAPELDGAMEFIRNCTSNGIVIAIGHSNASSEQITRAVENGARLSTHLGNGCANFIHRHNNPIWPQLAEDRLTATIIADGHHLLPEEIKVFHRVKGSDHIILTSDVIYLAGMSPGKYSFMGMEVVLRENGMLLNEELNCLAGASFPLKNGVENIMKFTGCSLSDAIKMASENVACFYGHKDRGSLKPGNHADLFLFERTGNHLQIKKTIKSGITVFQDSIQV